MARATPPRVSHENTLRMWRSHRFRVSIVLANWRIWASVTGLRPNGSASARGLVAA